MRPTEFLAKNLNRRRFLQRLGGGLIGVSAATQVLAAEDPALDLLMEQNQRGDLGQGFDATSRTIHMPESSLPTLSPATVATTEQAIGKYEGIVASGGWPVVPPVEKLRLGMRHASVPALRKRLTLAGDLGASGGDQDVFDSYVDAAVRRFQVRHGINEDGIVRKQEFDALNIPAPVRLSQLKTNLDRLKKETKGLNGRYVVCNLPAAQIEAIEDNVAVTRHTAVVGKPDRPSPDINSRIIEVNFNPYWTVPVSIVRRDLIPKMQEEPDYLGKNHIRIFDMHNTELQPSQINWYSNEAVNFRFKQDPGAFNSLGSIRINFPSKDGVYMHDTPLKNLFGEDMRFHSSGCVRVQNVRELVDWLLRDTPGWSRPEIDAVIQSGDRKDARLKKPVPLHWVYVTAWATPDGVVQFRDDIYNRDGLGQYATNFKG
jgi:murein L,D-transpeptidase YcbB/YkuD